MRLVPILVAPLAFACASQPSWTTVERPVITDGQRCYHGASIGQLHATLADRNARAEAVRQLVLDTTTASAAVGLKIKTSSAAAIEFSRGDGPDFTANVTRTFTAPNRSARYPDIGFDLVDVHAEVCIAAAEHTKIHSGGPVVMTPKTDGAKAALDNKDLAAFSAVDASQELNTRLDAGLEVKWLDAPVVGDGGASLRVEVSFEGAPAKTVNLTCNGCDVTSADGATATLAIATVEQPAVTLVVSVGQASRSLRAFARPKNSVLVCASGALQPYATRVFDALAETPVARMSPEVCALADAKTHADHYVRLASGKPKCSTRKGKRRCKIALGAKVGKKKIVVKKTAVGDDDDAATTAAYNDAATDLGTRLAAALLAG